MSLRLKIVQAGDPVLRQQARCLTREDILSDGIQDVIEWMRETMRDAPGVGLAAPQVGVPIQLAVIEDRAELLKGVAPEKLAERGRRAIPFHVIINPVLSLGSDPVTFFEGCLSVAGLTALVPRALNAEVRCLNHAGEEVSLRADGWYARILQHEIDHLNGRLYVDRMITRSLMTIDNHARYWNDLPFEKLREEFLQSPPG